MTVLPEGTVYKLRLWVFFAASSVPLALASNVRHQMSPHPLTLAYLQAVAKRPGMFMGSDFDLDYLRLQLFGYDAALADAGILGEHERFNFAFNRYLEHQCSIMCPLGWADALQQRYGKGEAVFNEFLALVARATSPGQSAQT
jgi:hypothetical protein